MDVILSELANWDSFYVIVGSAAGALIGLQFVVLTLLAQKSLHKDTAQAGAAFATPTIVHFSVVLFLSALLMAPWQTITLPLAVISLAGFGGMVYIGIVIFRMKHQESYRPGSEDWLFHSMLPFIAYAVLAALPFIAVRYPSEIFFGIGAAVLLLLFVGIHNAWDNVAYAVFFHDVENE